jgi:hypothetical protein
MDPLSPTPEEEYEQLVNALMDLFRRDGRTITHAVRGDYPRPEPIDGFMPEVAGIQTFKEEHVPIFGKRERPILGAAIKCEDLGREETGQKIVAFAKRCLVYVMVPARCYPSEESEVEQFWINLYLEDYIRRTGDHIEGVSVGRPWP